MREKMSKIKELTNDKCCLDLTAFETIYQHIVPSPREREKDMVGCFWVNGSLRQYFSLYRTVSRRVGERFGWLFLV